MKALSIMIPLSVRLIIISAIICSISCKKTRPISIESDARELINSNRAVPSATWLCIESNSGYAEFEWIANTKDVCHWIQSWRVLKIDQSKEFYSYVAELLKHKKTVLLCNNVKDLEIKGKTKSCYIHVSLIYVSDLKTKCKISLDNLDYVSKENFISKPIFKTANSVSLVEMIGLFPLIVAFSAAFLGLLAFVIRNKTLTQSILIFQFAIGVLGIAITCWRLYVLNVDYYDTAPDLRMWAFEFSYAWTAAAVILTGVSIGSIFIGLAWLLKKQTEQDVAPDGE